MGAVGSVNLFVLGEIAHREGRKFFKKKLCKQFCTSGMGSSKSYLSEKKKISFPQTQES